MKHKIVLGDEEVEVDVLSQGQDHMALSYKGREYHFQMSGNAQSQRLIGKEGKAHTVLWSAPGKAYLNGVEGHLEKAQKSTKKKGAGPDGLGKSLLTPMPGRILKLTVKAGDKVDKGAPLAVLEAMKMEHVLKAPRNCTILKVHAKEGEQISGGVPLFDLGE